MSDNRSIPEDSRAVVQETGELYQDACTIIEQAQAMAYRAVNEVLIKRNWLLGMRRQTGGIWRTGGQRPCKRTDKTVWLGLFSQQLI